MSVATEQAAEYRELQAEGLSVREIARRKGLTESAIVNRLYDPDGSKQKARRSRYQGICKECGAATDGSNGRAKAPEYCPRHYWLKPGYRDSRTEWPRERIINAIQDWNREYGEPPATTDWNATRARQMGRPDRTDRFLDGFATGRWPWFTTVVYHFGSWNAGIEAAGFTPRQADGGGPNMLRNLRVQRAGLRRQAIQELCDRGFRRYEIAGLVWREWGYANQHSAYTSVSHGVTDPPRPQLAEQELAELRALGVES